MRRRIAAAAVAAVGISAIAIVVEEARAQVFPVDREFAVNTYTLGNQTYPAVAVLPTGEFVVIWQSPDASEYGLFGRRFAANGSPDGPQFGVHSNTFGTQVFADIDVNSAGDFVVVWESNRNGSLDIFARRFLSSGAAIGIEVQVNDYSTGTQRVPQVAVREDGGFIVAWQSAGEDGSLNGLFARRYDSAGTPLDPILQVNDYTTNSQSSPAIDAEPDGDFVIAWTGAGPGALAGTWARRFASTGSPVGASFAVSPHTNYHFGADIAVAADGTFVVAWADYTNAASDFDVFARRVSGITPLATEFQVSTSTIEDQGAPAIAMEADGDFVIAWNAGHAGPVYEDIFARGFAASGAPETGELRVNTYQAEGQRQPAIAVSPKGPSFVVTWQSLSQDGANDGIFGQRLGGLMVDIDGNGVSDPLTDGLLFLRYLFGFSGQSLIDGAVADDCGRCTAPEIETFLDDIL